MVDESDAVIGEGEDGGVLTSHAGWSEQLAGRLFKLEPLAVPAQAVSTDAPRSLSGRGHVRVGNHEPPDAVVLHPLYPRVLKVQRAPDT